MEVKKLVLGLVLVAAGVGTFAWNESRSGSTKNALAEMASAAVELGSVDKADASFNGKLVHVTGMVTVDAPTVDPVFGTAVNNTVSMTRTAEFYQWREKKEENTVQKADGSKETKVTYSYSKDWTDRPIDHKSFNGPGSSHVNVTYIDAPKSGTFYSQNAKLGAYTLSEPLLRSMGNSGECKISMDRDAKLALARTMAEKHPGVTRHMCGLPTTADISEAAARAADKLIFVDKDTLYIGVNPFMPTVGDVRIKYRGAAPSEISVMAVVDGTVLKPFKAKDGREVVSVVSGKKSLQEMNASQQSGNNSLTWIFRVIAVLLAAAGAFVMVRKSK